MASLSPHHKELTDGEGRCSVPMWQMGCPAGFCDRKAYGKQRPPSSQEEVYNQPPYAPGLACPAHAGPSGPKEEVGDEDRIDLMESEEAALRRLALELEQERAKTLELSGLLDERDRQLLEMEVEARAELRDLREELRNVQGDLYAERLSDD